MISKPRPAISGTPRIRGGEQQVPRRQPDRGEDEDGHDHHDQQEARPAARVQAREALRVPGRERRARPRSRRSSCARRRGTRTPGAGRAGARAARCSRGRSRCARSPRRARTGRRAELVLEQAGEADRDDEEQADGEGERDDDGAEPHAAGDRLLVLGAAARWPTCSSALKPMLSDSTSATTPRITGQAQHAVALGPRDQRERLDSISPTLGRAAPRAPRACARPPPRSRRRASSRPRARPGRPTGASRWRHEAAVGQAVSARHACDRQPSRASALRAEPPRARLAARRWKRSTRPPVSTSFCLPV